MDSGSRLEFHPLQHLLYYVVIIVLFSSCCRCATEYSVGNISASEGYSWKIPDQSDFYQAWADNITFYSDDNFSFFYDYDLHDILWVPTLAELDNCTYNNTDYVFYAHDNLTGAEIIYFPQPFEGWIYVMSRWSVNDCANGMKFKLYVHPAQTVESPGYSPAAAPTTDDQGVSTFGNSSGTPLVPTLRIPWHPQSVPDWNITNSFRLLKNSSFQLPINGTVDIQFNFSESYSVFKVNSSSFDSCTGTDGLSEQYYTTSHISVGDGPNYFIDGNYSNCNSFFMKIILVVPTDGSAGSPGTPSGLGPNSDGSSSGSSSSSNSMTLIVASVTASVCAAIFVLVGGLWWYCKGRKRVVVQNSRSVFGSQHPWSAGSTAAQAAQIENFNNILAGPSCRIFSWEELEKATNTFSVDNKLGAGGFGTVFKGTLDDGTVVAIKRSKNAGGSDREQFINEVAILSQLNHRNLLKLLGCCVDSQLDVPLLVFEFISNGTLQEHLASAEKRYPTKLDWKTRLKIAIQTAEALKYLHVQANPPIIHRDVKSANILLDENLCAKVADFGLSKLVDNLDATHVSTMVKGTPGYLDPDYYHDSRLTDKTDVYSFGVVLLELLTSKKPLDNTITSGSQNLARICIPLIRNGNIREIIDPHLLNSGMSDEVFGTIQGVAQVAVACLVTERESRPTMSQVVEMLQKLKGSTLTAEEFYKNDSSVAQEPLEMELQASYKKLLTQAGSDSLQW